MRKPSIVVVEAYSAMGLLLDDLLTEAGYEVRLWPDSTGAFEFIRQEHPDLVILDLSIKRHGDGLAVLDRLCRHNTTSSIPVIVFADDSLVASMLGVFSIPWRFEVLDTPLYLDLLMTKVQRVVDPLRATLNVSKKTAVGHRDTALIAG